MPAKAHLEEKKIFLVASGNSVAVKLIEETILKHFSRSTVFTSLDGLDAVSKLQNAPPHVIFTDTVLPKLAPLKLIDVALSAHGAEGTAVIACGQLPEDGHYLDEIVTGRVQFLPQELNEDMIMRALTKALNFSSHKDKADYYLRFLAPGEILLKQGEKGEAVYFVKKGQLEAFRTEGQVEVSLGKIDLGEFVGEMAYINGEVRSANVRAISDCELIEVPIGTFDHVLFKRPAWSKALMMTLAKRVKAANKNNKAS